MGARPQSKGCLTKENDANEESLEKKTEAGPSGREGRE